MLASGPRSRRLAGTGAVLALVVALVPACSTGTTTERRERALVIEGQVRQLVGSEAFRVSPPESTERGVLVLAIGHPRPRRLDRVRVAGLQHTLRLPELERVVGAELDAYRRYEGEEVLVADVVEVTRDRVVTCG